MERVGHLPQLHGTGGTLAMSTGTHPGRVQFDIVLILDGVTCIEGDLEIEGTSRRMP